MDYKDYLWKEVKITDLFREWQWRIVKDFDWDCYFLSNNEDFAWWWESLIKQFQYLWLRYAIRIQKWNGWSYGCKIELIWNNFRFIS